MNWLRKISELSEQSLDRLKSTYNQIIDQKECGDYELYLIFFEPMNIYQVAIQRKGLDFTDIEQQTSKQEILFTQNPDLKQIKSTLLSWKSTYGDLIVKSHDLSKTQKYFNILSGLGLNPEWKSFGPIRVIKI